MKLTFLVLASSVLLTAQSIRPADLLPRNVIVEDVSFKGRTATRLTDKATGDLPDGQSFNAFYPRPYNDRSKDDVPRNHSAQYIFVPEFGWRKLREAPSSLSHFSKVRISK